MTNRQLYRFQSDTTVIKNLVLHDSLNTEMIERIRDDILKATAPDPPKLTSASASTVRARRKAFKKAKRTHRGEMN